MRTPTSYQTISYCIFSIFFSVCGRIAKCVAIYIKATKVHFPLVLFQDFQSVDDFLYV